MFAETNAKPYVSYNKIPVLVRWEGSERTFQSMRMAYYYLKGYSNPTTDFNEGEGRVLDTYNKFQKFMRDKRTATVYIKVVVGLFTCDLYQPITIIKHY